MIRRQPLFLLDHPEFVEEAGKKSSELDDRLKKVFVTSSEYVSLFYNLRIIELKVFL